MSSTPTPGLEVSTLVSLEADGEHSFLDGSGLDEVISTQRGFKESCCMAVTATVAMGLSHRPVLLMSLCLLWPTACQPVREVNKCGRRRLAVSPLSASIHVRTERTVRDTAETGTESHIKVLAQMLWASKLKMSQINFCNRQYLDVLSLFQHRIRGVVVYKD